MEDNNNPDLKGKKKETHKEFKLSSLSVDNRITVFVLTAIIFIAGVFSYTSMPKENFPEVVTPEIYVGAPYPGNSPLDIEKLITRPLEKEINTITGIDEINSTSQQGYSSIQVKFNFDVEPTEALRKVKDKVDIAKADPDFPKDLPADPNIFEMNFSELIPIMNINLSGDFSLDQLKEFGEYLEDKIENVPQINKVDIRGIQDKEVKIKVDLPKMESLNISFNDIGQAIQQENVTISGGDLLVDNFRRTIRVVGEYSNMQQIENTIIKQEKQNIVYLRDIADIEFDEEDKESFARQYQKPVVMLDVIKRAGENLLESSDEIQRIIEEAKENVFPENLKISITSDQSDQTRTQVSELENSIIFGVILVVGVLMFFLGFRNAAFVGIAIPLSMFLSFFILSAMGVTLNVMVLFSLVLALGMLVDNGIVVVENIYRLMDEGMKPLQAAKNGVGEVALPIIASTATTLAAFLPLALWPGQMGAFMKYLPMTLMIVLSSSLFVALVINPVLTSVFMKVGEEQIDKKKFLRRSFILIVFGVVVAGLSYMGMHMIIVMLSIMTLLSGLLAALIIYLAIKKLRKRYVNKLLITSLIAFIVFLFGLGGQKALTVLGNLSTTAGVLGYLYYYLFAPGTKTFQTKVIPALENRYRNFLRFALGKRPRTFFIGTIGMLVLALVLIIVLPPKTEFFPANEPQYVNVFIEMPIGTDIEATNEVTKDIEETVIKIVSQDKFLDTNPETGEQKNFMVESVIGQVGEGTSDPAQGVSLGNTPHKARITVQFVKYQDRRGISSGEVLKEIRDGISDYPGVQISVAKNENGPPQGAPISIELSGDDYYQLMAEAEGIKAYINEGNIGGIENLKLDVEQGKPEMPIVIDREKARRFNVSTYQVGDAMRTALFGKEVSRYKEGEDDYPINIRLNDEYRYDADALLNQRITFRDQASGKIQQVPISAIATAEKSSTFSAVKRTDLTRIITITSNVLQEKGYNANEVVANIKKRLESYEMPEGVSLKFSGQQEEQAKEMSFLGGALMIAVFLIFLIMVSQFNSASSPFIILVSIIFSLTGVLLGLVIFRMEFIIIMTMIGIISLAGIVVNNAIVLIDYTNLTMKRKREELGLGEEDRLSLEDIMDCIIESGRTRLRPVLLTAITTILGLLPLAVGLNIDFNGLFTNLDPNIYIGGDNVIFWGPMSWAIIFGLTFATFLTLVIVPVMYYLLSRVKARFNIKATN